MVAAPSRASSAGCANFGDRTGRPAHRPGRRGALCGDGRRRLDLHRLAAVRRVVRRPAGRRRRSPPRSCRPTTGASSWSARAASPWRGWPASGWSSPRSGSGTSRAGPRPAGRASSGSPGGGTTRRAQAYEAAAEHAVRILGAARPPAPGGDRRRPGRRRRGAGDPRLARLVPVVEPWLPVPDPQPRRAGAGRRARPAPCARSQADDRATGLALADRGRRVTTLGHRHPRHWSSPSGRPGPSTGSTCRSPRVRCTGSSGPNGAGKSTTIRVLLGLLRDDAGDGAAARRRPVARRGRAAPAARLRPRRRQPVAQPHRRRGDRPARPAARRARRAAAATELLERFELDPTKKARTYSKGNRQKVALVAALASDVELLLLDEPTSGLDPLMESVFRDCVDDFRDRRAHRAAVQPHPRRGRGAVRPGEHHPGRPVRRVRHPRRAAAPHPHLGHRPSWPAPPGAGRPGRRPRPRRSTATGCASRSTPSQLDDGARRAQRAGVRSR